MNDSIKNSIVEKLDKHFQPNFLDVENESHQHNVPPNSETHFKVTLVSEHFAGKPLVRRHQSIYTLLRHEMGAGGVHALALHTYTPEEWQQKAQPVTASPPCLGGS